jgi:hypothetical protein
MTNPQSPTIGALFSISSKLHTVATDIEHTSKKAPQFLGIDIFPCLPMVANYKGNKWTRGTKRSSVLTLLFLFTPSHR